MHKHKISMDFLIVAFVIIALFVPTMAGDTIADDCGCDESIEYQPADEVIGDNAAAIYSIEELCGLEEPENWWVDAKFDPSPPRGDLPDQFDWRDIVELPPVKSQGSCGSCWAFATVGPLECNIKIKDGVTVDLSEQWLVSCTDAGSCSGGWFAHEYHEWRPDYCGDTGAVLEEYFPYVAYNAPCNCPYPHDYLIDDWAFIGSSQGVPPVNSMKQAIMDYGPISVAVCANGFSGYNGGIFTGCSGGQVNHAVVLVGWDDNQGSSGVWFMRNSWGTGWGEDGGYMRIPYGCSSIGYAACYINYEGAPINLNFPEGLPAEVIPGEPTSIIVQIEEVGDTYIPGTGMLHYHYEGISYYSSPLVPLGGDLYEATLPPASYGDDPEYYFSIEGEQSGVITSPPDAPDTTYHSTVAEPEFEISLRGKLLIGTKVRNIGMVDAENVVCTIYIKGGMAGKINVSDEDHIGKLEIDTRETFRLNRLAFGLGKVDIKVTVDSDNSGKSSKGFSGFAFLGAVFVID